MSGGSNTQTQTSTSEPYSAAKPLLNQGMGDAKKLYDVGALAPVNTSSTVVPYAQQTMAGMNNIQQGAQDQMAPGGLQSQFNDIISNGGFNAPQMDAVNNTRSLANSSYDMNANPGFADVLRQAQEGSMYGSNANAAGMGRYGSGTHQGVQQRELGDLTGRMVYNDYNNWLGRRDNANTQLFGMGQTGMDNMAPAYQNSQLPAQALMGVGAQYEDLAGRQLNDQLRITDAKQNQQYNSILRLMATAGGAGDYGTQTTSAQMPSSTMSNMLGYGLGGASLAQAMGIL